MQTLESASAELRDLMYGRTQWLYAFAMGSGCTLEAGGHEVLQAIRDRDAHLRAVIAEHTLPAG
jgi:hypothetical protein